ncbi:hypothetical protein NX059_003494 [Plenodomus lindquistii]|nr:hypothetical protein NX059_003494 [Plenodomus lindquistii]
MRSYWEQPTCIQPSSNRPPDADAFLFPSSPVRNSDWPAKQLSSSLPNSNVFSNLFLDCEEVSSDRTAASPGTPLASFDWTSRDCDSPLQSVEDDLLLDVLPEELQVDFLLNELLSMAPVTRTRSTISRTKAAVKQKSPSRLAKQPAAKQKTPSPKARKCATPTRLTAPMKHDAKRRKTEANNSRKLNPQESSPDGDSLAPMIKVDSPDVHDIIEISDGEYEEVKAPPRSSFSARLGQSRADACNHTQELKQLQQELAASKQETKAAREATNMANAEREAARTLLRAKDEEITSIKHRNDEQAKSLQSAQNTIKKLEASLKDVLKERGALEAHSEEHKYLVSDRALVTAELKVAERNFQALQQKLAAVEKEHIVVVQDLTERLFSAETTQSPPRSRLTPATSPLSPLSSISSTFHQSIKQDTPPATPSFPPHPSRDYATTTASPFQSISSLEEKKDENVRKVYTKLKPQYDKQRSLLVKVENCTRGMDLSCFGEFGALVRQARAMLQQDELEGPGADLRSR